MAPARQSPNRQMSCIESDPTRTVRRQPECRLHCMVRSASPPAQTEAPGTLLHHRGRYLVGLSSLTWHRSHQRENDSTSANMAWRIGLVRDIQRAITREMSADNSAVRGSTGDHAPRRECPNFLSDCPLQNWGRGLQYSRARNDHEDKAVHRIVYGDPLLLRRLDVRSQLQTGGLLGNY